jgi:hypothetical protein
MAPVSADHHFRHPAGLRGVHHGRAAGAGDGQDQHDQAVLDLLSGESADQLWWLGYLDTAADDMVFPGVPMVTLCSGWRYVLVEAGPQQAATWRQHDRPSFWKGALPNVDFPPTARGWCRRCGTTTGPALAVLRSW